MILDRFRIYMTSLYDNAIDVFLGSQSEQHLIEPIEGDDENMLSTWKWIRTRPSLADG